MFNLFKNINKVCDRHRDKILNKKDVVAYGVGTKYTKGFDTGRQAICVFVKKKLPEAMLLAEEKISKKLGGFETDVFECGEIIPMTGHRGRHRPVQGSISGKVSGGTSCTLGLVVYKNGKKGIWTNEHCAHFQKDRTGSHFLQPSPGDGGLNQDSIGIITDPPRISNDKINKIDGIFIPLSVEGETKIFNHGDYPKKWVEPRLGLKIWKIGRTTGRTEAVITHINMTANVNFGGNLGVNRFFPTFFAIQNNWDFIAGGDSGSIVMCEEGVVGQVFSAASNFGIMTYGSVNRDELGITLKEKEVGFISFRHTWVGANRTLVKLNLRREPRIGNNIVRVLQPQTPIRILRYAGFFSGHHWLEIEV